MLWQDDMQAIRDGRKAGPDSRRWGALRWLTVALVLFALGLAGVPKADAHSLQDHSAPVEVTGLQDFPSEGVYCCDEAEPGHLGEACSALGHCIGCPLEIAAVSAPALPPTAGFGLRAKSLPTSRATGPAGHPPKTA
jgi:hypothetical protein